MLVINLPNLIPLKWESLLPTVISNERGFTLIELVVVIVILGILGAVAVPKFVNMKERAIISSMEDLVGALQTASTLAHAKARIDGVDSQPTSTIIAEGETIELAYGFPSIPPNNTTPVYGITKMVDTPSGWKVRHSTVYDAWVYWPEVIPVDAGTASCYVRYRKAAAAGSRPQIDFTTSGCRNY